MRDLLLINELGLNAGGLLRNTWYGVAIEVDGNARELNSAYFDLTGNDGRRDLSRKRLDDPPAHPIARLMLGRLYVHTGEATKARPLLEMVRHDSSLSQADRDEAAALLEVP